MSETPQTVRDAAEILEYQGFQKAASRLRDAAVAWGDDRYKSAHVIHALRVQLAEANERIFRLENIILERDGLPPRKSYEQLGVVSNSTHMGTTHDDPKELP